MSRRTLNVSPETLEKCKELRRKFEAQNHVEVSLQEIADRVFSLPESIEKQILEQDRKLRVKWD